jgi:DNA-binding NtrC family response regulator
MARMMLDCINMDGLVVNASRSAAEAMSNHQQAKRQPTILALSDDPGLVEVLLKTCNRPWKVKVTDDFTSCLQLVPEGDCRVVVVDDQTLAEVDRGWLLNRIQNWIPRAFIIYIASEHGPDVERTARSRGAGYYLSKPLDSERLTHLLSGLQRLYPS